MDLPPSWYFLLLLVTALAAPFLVRSARSPQRRRSVTRILVGLLLFEAGLVLLYYAKALCWPLVSIGIAAIASATPARGRLRVALWLLVPAVAAGTGFQLLPGLQAFYFYFGFALPLLLGTALAFAVARDASSGERRLVAASVALLAFAAFSPASSFGFTLLVHYEIFQLPVLLAGLAGLAVIARTEVPGAAATDRPKVQTTLADRLAAPWRTHVAMGSIIVVAGVGVGSLALRHAPLPGLFFLVAWGAVGLALVAAGFAVTGPGRRVAGESITLAAVAGAFASVLGVRFGAEAFHVFVGGGPAPETVYFYLAGIGILSFLWAASLGLGRWSERLARNRMADDPLHLVRPLPLDTASLPEGYHVEQVPQMLDVAGLERFAVRLVAMGKTGGVVEILDPTMDPLQEIPEEVAQWLDRQTGPALVHLAIHEGKEAFLVPILDVEVAL